MEDTLTRKKMKAKEKYMHRIHLKCLYGTDTFTRTLLQDLHKLSLFDTHK